MSDSKSVLEKLAALLISAQNSHLVLCIKDAILYIRLAQESGIKVELRIPSHCGIVRNERADAATKEATMSGMRCAVRVPFRDVKNFLKDKLYEEFSEWAFHLVGKKGSFYYNNLFSGKKKT